MTPETTRCYWRGNHKCAFFFVIPPQGERQSQCNLVQNHPFQCKKKSISRKELSSETFFYLLSPMSTIEVDVIFINLIFEYETEAEDLSHPHVSELLTRIVTPNWHFLRSSRLNAQILTASRGSQAWTASRPELDFQIFRLDFSRVSKHIRKWTYIFAPYFENGIIRWQPEIFQKSLLAESTFSGSKHWEGGSPGNGPVLAVVLPVLSFL